VWWSPQALSPEVYQHLERHWAKGFEAYGVSPSAASGQKEAGVTSAVAIRESLDVQTARFAVLAQRWEQLHLDVARAAIDIARDIYAENKEMIVSAPGTQLLGDRGKFSDLEDEDAYVIQEYPTSLLPTTPQGRIDRVKDLVSSTLWSPKRGEAALDDLDVDAEMNADMRQREGGEHICQDMLSLRQVPHARPGDGPDHGPAHRLDLPGDGRDQARHPRQARRPALQVARRRCRRRAGHEAAASTGPCARTWRASGWSRPDARRGLVPQPS
jgi:hypothetical protein